MSTQAGPPPMVQATGVSKWFGDLVAVSDVSFAIGAGVTALLGPNGAGKSTLLRMMCGLAKPSNGSLTVLGKDPRADVAVLGRIGMAPQQESLLDYLSGREFVELAAQLHHVDHPVEAARQAIQTVELNPDDPRKLSTYSKGMRQRIKLAQAIVHDPLVIALDEPLTGLDPRQRREMIQLFHRLGSEGKCVIVSSHVLDEVERFGSRVLVIAQGRLAAEGDFREIRNLMDDRPLRISIRTNQPRALAIALLDRGAISGCRLEADNLVVVDTSDAVAFRRAVAPAARDQDASLLELRPLDDDLESVFRYLVMR
ncbi:MAG: ABC transporter ATP-binding protein [bacterium]|nr:ABC transporter ATP-binding protein [bacterium]MXZ76700.1 ABC transporter ATP-binding protein [Acidimicrobiia bacterium]MXZ86954.1 ABC transporter ATP-binding protein [Acidimicrobiia bacterium]MYE72329.1 ABC transporter ATP-binding protein [Acidimicrobiia bacterium]MYG72352.1 ABC transporter ATP-binding protein [Acidimicrobiia bacterium]